MKPQNTGPYALRKRLNEAVRQVSVKVSQMTFEERRAAGLKAYLKFINKEPSLTQ